MLMIMQMKHGSRVQERIYRPMIHSTSCAQRARWLAEACAQAEHSVRQAAVRNRRSSTTRDVVIFCAYNASCLRGGVMHSPAKVRDRKRQERRAKTCRLQSTSERSIENRKSGQVGASKAIASPRETSQKRREPAPPLSLSLPPL